VELKSVAWKADKQPISVPEEWGAAMAWDEDADDEEVVDEGEHPHWSISLRFPRFTADPDPIVSPVAAEPSRLSNLRTVAPAPTSGRLRVDRRGGASRGRGGLDERSRGAAEGRCSTHTSPSQTALPCLKTQELSLYLASRWVARQAHLTANAKFMERLVIMDKGKSLGIWGIDDPFRLWCVKVTLASDSWLCML